MAGGSGVEEGEAAMIRPDALVDHQPVVVRPAVLQREADGKQVLFVHKPGDRR